MREDDAPCHRWDETGSKAERGKLRGASGCRCFSVKLSIRGGHDVVHREVKFLSQRSEGAEVLTAFVLVPLQHRRMPPGAEEFPNPSRRVAGHPEQGRPPWNREP